MVARGILQTPDLFEGRIYLGAIWHLLKDTAIYVEDELLLGQATISALPEGEERIKALSNISKLLHPDALSPFEDLIKRYKDLLPHATGEQMQIRMNKGT